MAQCRMLCVSLLVVMAAAPLASSDKFLSYLGINERLAISNLSGIIQNQAAPFIIPTTTATTTPILNENNNFLGVNQSGFFNRSYLTGNGLVHTNQFDAGSSSENGGVGSNAASVGANSSAVGETLTFSPGLTVVIAIIASMMSFITIIGNVLVITAFIIDKNLRKYSNYFILNLSIADLLIGLLIPPYAPFLLYNRHWRIGRVACTIWLVLDYVVGSASVLCIVVISLDRYLLVSRGLKYVADQKVSKAICIMVTVWLIAFFNYAPAIIFWEFISGKRTVKDGDCQVEFHDNLPYLTATACVEFFAPFISITALNLAVYLNIRKRSRGLIRSQKPHFTLPKEMTGAPTTTNAPSGPSVQSETNGKLHKMSTEPDRKTNSLTSNDILLSDKAAQKMFELANNSYMNHETCEIEESAKGARKRTVGKGSKLTFKEPGSSREPSEVAVVVVKGPKKSSLSKGKFRISPGAILKNKTSPRSYSSTSSSISIASSSYDEKPLKKKYSAEERPERNGKLLMRFAADDDDDDDDDFENDNEIYVDCDGDSRVDRDELIKLNEMVDKSAAAKTPVETILLTTTTTTTTSHVTSELLAAKNSKSQSTRSKYKTTKFNNEMPTDNYGRSNSQPAAAVKGSFEKQILVKTNNLSGKKKSYSQTTTTSSLLLSKGGSIALSNTNIPMSKKSSSATLTKDKKAARSLFILVFVFVFCWAPYTFLTLIKSVCPTCVNDNVYEFAFWLLWFNSTFNPILYPFLHVKFRKAFYKILTCVLFCCFNKNRNRDYGGGGGGGGTTVATQSVANTNRTRIFSEKPSYDS